MDTPTLFLILDELITMLVLEERLLKLLSAVGPAPGIPELSKKHRIATLELKKLLRRYEKFTRPGYYHL
jgi:hypothetical protein